MISVYCIVLPSILFLALVRKFQEYRWGYCKNKTNLSGKTVLVTGANSGIGLELVYELSRRGAKVILACRDLEKAAQAITTVQKRLGTAGSLTAMHLDLASIKSVKSFVNELNKVENEIDILVNNAGVSYPKHERKTTEDSFEIHLGVNHLGHFLLTNLLLPNLKAATAKNTTPSRVIVVSSMLHQKGNIYLDDLNDTRGTSKSSYYNNSKLANIYFARELATRTTGDNINVYAVCPGWVYTGLFRNYNIKWYHYLFVMPIAFFYMRTPKQGAQTALYCATDPQLTSETGFLYRDCSRKESSVEFDTNVSKQLWELSERMVGI